MNEIVELLKHLYECDTFETPDSAYLYIVINGQPVSVYVYNAKE